MIFLVVPQEDFNSETAVLVAWLVEDTHSVQKGQPVCEVETSKMIFEVTSPAKGFLVQGIKEGKEVAFNVPIGIIVEKKSKIDDVVDGFLLKCNKIVW